MFNLLEMSNIDTDGNDRPINPPKILSTQVKINPFKDILVRDASKEEK